MKPYIIPQHPYLTKLTENGYQPGTWQIWNGPRSFHNPYPSKMRLKVRQDVGICATCNKPEAR